jgi:iron complex outermembrane receptor protein
MATKTCTSGVAQSALRAASLLAVCLPLTAHAQDGDADERIVVTATRVEKNLERVPAAVTVVTQDEIQLNRQQLALDESLTRVPGLYMQARYNFARDVRVSIRGFGSRANFGIRGVKIIVDGIPETLPDGQGVVDGIDLAATGQIEVLRGPSASLWGNASGGVISITTEPPPEEGFSELRLSGGEYDFQKIQFKTGAQGEKLGYIFSVTDSEYEGYREHALMENTQLTGRFNVDFGEGRELISILSYTDQPYSDDPGSLNATDAANNPRMAFANNVLYNAGESQEKTRVGAVYTMPLGDDQTLQARGFIVDRDFENLLPTMDGANVVLDSGFTGAGVSYTREGSLGDLPNTLIIGLDIERQDDDRLRYDNLFGDRGPLVFNQNEAVSSYGLFIQDDIGLTDMLTFTMGVRFDEIEYDITDYFLADGNDSGSVSVDDVSPMLGLSAVFSERLNAYATYSTAFEAPTTTEFNLPDGTSGGFNSSLEPQNARNLEVGVRGLISDRTRYEVAVFDIEVDDELVQFETPIADRYYFVNAAQSSRQGVEFSLSADLAENLTTTFSYTFSDFEFDRFIDESTNNFSGNVIPGVPEDLFFAEVLYQQPGGLFAGFDVIRVGEQYAENANNVLVDGYTVANLRIGYDLDSGSMQISPFVGINNLFDESYPGDVRINAAFGGRYFDPAPDRHLYAGVKVRFGR